MAYAKPAELAAELGRARFEAAEQARADSCLTAASSEIDGWIDWPHHEPDPAIWSEGERDLVRRVCLARAVEHWKAADAAFGAIGFSDIGVLRAPREGFYRHGMTLMPLKQGFGIA